MLEQMQRKAGKAQLEVIAVNYKEKPRVLRAVRRKLRDFEMTFTHDSDGAIGEQYGVKGVPHLLMIDREGTIAFVQIGFGKTETLDRMVERLNELLLETPALSP